MSTGKPVFEKSRSVQDMQQMRLMALLSELVQDKGIMKAAEALDVDHRTLTASMEQGRLSRRMRGALGKVLLEGGGSPSVEQRERNDSLDGRVTEVEGRVDALGKDLSKGLTAVRGDVKSLGDEHGRRLAQLESGREAQDAQATTGAAGKPQGRPSLRREFPDLVTIEPADDDADVFGNAWPLIVEWRELKAAHPNRGGGLEWLATEERLLTVELALLEDHGMTLPPETYPLRGFERDGQTSWRRTALYDTRRARRKRELLRRLTFGLLWR